VINIYTFLFYVFTPFIVARLLIKGIKLRDYHRRLGERFAFYRQSFSQVDVCVHAVSFGEVEAARQLIDGLLRSNYQLCVTTMTPTGSARVREIYGDRISHVYLPFDLPSSLRRFLKVFSPKLVLIMETEIWPNLYRQCQKEEISLLLANARLSERSFKGYLKLGRLIKPILGQIELIMAQTIGDKQRFCKLGALDNQVFVTGNMKFDIRIKGSEMEKATAFREMLGNRNIFVAASTHPGEEQQVLAAYAKVQTELPNAFLVLAPRHPERRDEVVKLLRSYKFNFQQSSSNRRPSLDTNVWLVDELGKLRTYYACADVAFVGGSLVRHGGHNVLEAIVHEVPVISGPHMFNFSSMKESLLQLKGILLVNNSNELAIAWLSLLKDSVLKKNQLKAATDFLHENQGAADRQLNQVISYLANHQCSDVL
jgi:3-deoxy-D-manno-octulosonic-acid transferase